MKTIEGKDLSEYVAAKMLYIKYGESMIRLSIPLIASAIKMEKLTDKQVNKIMEHFTKVSGRVKSYLKV